MILTEKKINNYITTRNAPELFKFERNLFIHKKSTGIGGTTAALSITDKRIVLVSPLTSMIKDKESQHNKPHQLFVYSKSRSRLKDVLQEDGSLKHNFVLNTTPEQLINRPDIFEKLLHDAYFILDEFDYYTTATYRLNKMEPFINGIKRASYPIVMTTATPAFDYVDAKYVCPDFDVITVTNSQYVEQTVHVQSHDQLLMKVANQLQQGNRVLVAVNDKQIIHKLVNEFKMYGTQRYLGDALTAKTAERERYTADEMYYSNKSEINPNANLHIISTKNAIGWDFTLQNSAVYVVTEEADEANSWTPQLIRQAIGRVRSQPTEICLFVKQLIDRDTNSPFTQKQKLERFEHQKRELKQNYTPESLLKLHEQMTYVQSEFTKIMKIYGFKVDYAPLQFDGRIASISTNFQKGWDEIQKHDEDTLKQLVKYCINNIQGKLGGVPNRIAVKLFATYIFKKTGMKRPRARMDEVLAAVNGLCYAVESIRVQISENSARRIAVTDQDVLDRADELWCSDMTFQQSLTAIMYIHTVYCMNNVIPADVMEKLEARHTFETKLADIIQNACEKYRAFTPKEMWIAAQSVDWSYVRKQAHNAVRYLCENKKRVMEIYDKAIDSVKKELTDPDTHVQIVIDRLRNSKAVQLSNYREHIMFACHKHVTNHREVGNGNFKVKTVNKDSHREYNPTVMCMRELRYVLPWQTQRTDIASGYPRYVDHLLGTDVAYKLYDLMVEKLEVTRAQAKVIVNKAFNNHYQDHKKVVRQLKSWKVYTNQQVEKLADIITAEKGSFFYQASQWERAVMASYAKENHLQRYIRVHDELMVFDACKLPEHHVYDRMYIKMGA